MYILLSIILLAFLIQTELTATLQLTFRQPCFIFYITHSSFMLVLPLHVLYLGQTDTITSVLRGIVYGERWWGMMGGLMVLLTIPSCLWYIAINLTSLANLTAIYNTNAFWIYAISVVYLRLSFSVVKLSTVIMAIGGVLLIAFGSASEDGEKSDWKGDVMAAMASFTFAIYACALQKYGSITKEQAKSLPDGLHPSLITSVIGLLTFVTLWVFLPILHYTKLELFLWPDGKQWCYIIGIASMGLIYNAGFMNLLYTYGAIMSSVAALLSIVLVVLYDMFIKKSFMSVMEFIGCAFIVIAFAILARQVYDDSITGDKEEMIPLH